MEGDCIWSWFESGQVDCEMQHNAISLPISLTQSEFLIDFKIYTSFIWFDSSFSLINDETMKLQLNRNCTVTNSSIK